MARCGGCWTGRWHRRASDDGAGDGGGGGKVETALIAGDLSRLSEGERLAYYQAVCDSLGLNKLTRPFDYLTLNGKLVLYAKRDATDQLRKLRQVSIERLERERLDAIYLVTAYARDQAGRTDSSIGAVSVRGLSGDALANAYMKAETKAKRRVTLSICGLGMLDETEIETIPAAERQTAPSPRTLPVAPGARTRMTVIDHPPRPAGTGANPIGPTVMAQLEALAAAKGMDAADLARARFGKEVHELVRAEAKEIHEALSALADADGADGDDDAE